VEVKSHQFQIAELIANLQAEALCLTSQMKAHIEAQTLSTITAASNEAPPPIRDQMRKIETSIASLTPTFTKLMEKETKQELHGQSKPKSPAIQSKKHVQNHSSDESPTSNQSK
jgi:tRNA U34 5-methylaminomethyl-2-thiouridine-forming methyltransferase MnmC